MNKEEKLRKNIEFKKVYRRGKSCANHLVVLYVYKNYNNKNINRVGISVSKKVGKSVIRSRVKRLILESYRVHKDELEKGYDLVFIARTNINDKNFKEVDSALINVVKKAGIYN
ncbi:ribonuclease P protein component [Clostridium sp. DL1XJH146]